MSYATTDDVVTELGRPASSTAESGKWQAWIERVERAIGRRLKRLGYDLAEQIAAGALSTADVVDVEVAAVLRKIDNPTGPTSITTSVDDGTVTKRWETATGADPLDLTDGEWLVLLPSDGFGGAFSTRPGFEPDTTSTDCLGWS